jgi:hypothetical protein
VGWEESEWWRREAETWSPGWPGAWGICGFILLGWTAESKVKVLVCCLVVRMCGPGFFSNRIITIPCKICGER